MKDYEKSLKRSDYFKKYYEENKESYKANYNAQRLFIRWVLIKKTLFKLKRQIGSNNYDLIMDELDKLEKEKH